MGHELSSYLMVPTVLLAFGWFLGSLPVGWNLASRYRKWMKIPHYRDGGEWVYVMTVFFGGFLGGMGIIAFSIHFFG